MILIGSKQADAFRTSELQQCHIIVVQVLLHVECSFSFRTNRLQRPCEGEQRRENVPDVIAGCGEHGRRSAGLRRLVDAKPARTERHLVSYTDINFQIYVYVHYSRVYRYNTIMY